MTETIRRYLQPDPAGVVPVGDVLRRLRAAGLQITKDELLVASPAPLTIAGGRLSYAGYRLA